MNRLVCKGAGEEKYSESIKANRDNFDISFNRKEQFERFLAQSKSFDVLRSKISAREEEATSGGSVRWLVRPERICKLLVLVELRLRVAWTKPAQFGQSLGAPIRLANASSMFAVLPDRNKHQRDNLCHSDIIRLYKAGRSSRVWP